MNEKFEMVWSKHNCKIEDGKIIEIKKPEVNRPEVKFLAALNKQTYNPFDYYNNENHVNLYLKFIAINENKNEDIISFVQNYGILGLYNDVHRIRRSKELYIESLENYPTRAIETVDEFKKAYDGFYDSFIHTLIEDVAQDPGKALEKLKLIKNLREKNNNSIQPLIPSQPIKHNKHDNYMDWFIEALNCTAEESVEEFIKELKRMRVIVSMREAIATNNIEYLKFGIDFLDEMNWQEAEGEPWRSYSSEYKSILETNEDQADDIRFLTLCANISIKREVNKQLLNVNPVINFDGYFEDEQQFHGTWKANNLLSAMYVMLYMDLIGGKGIKKCQNKTCPEWFVVYGNDDRKIYCDNTCARQQAQREYRKRKKVKEGK